MGTDRTIPEAVVEQVAQAMRRGIWNDELSWLEAARFAASAIPPLTGPGPNGGWGRWHGPVFFENHPDWPALYRFVPEATND